MRKSKIDKISMTAYAVVICAFFLNFVGNYPQFQMSPIAPDVMGLYNLDAAQFSALFSSAMIPGILLSLVCGLLCDRFGLKRCIGVAALISAAAVTARLFADSFTALFICFVIVGVLPTFVNSNISKLVGRWFPPRHVGIMVGFVMAGATAASAVGVGTTALLPDINTAYLIAAGLSIAAAIAWWVFAREKPKTVEIEEEVAPNTPSLSECLKVVLSCKVIWFTGITVGLILAANMVGNTFLPTALQEIRGMEATVAGGMTSALTFGGLAGTLLVPFINAKLKMMKPTVIVCIIGAALGTAFAWQMPEGLLLILALGITGFCCSGVIVSLMSLPVLLLEIGPLYAGTAGGVVATIQLLCGVVLPSYVITPIVGSNYPLLFLIGGALAVGALLVSLLLPDVLKQQVHEFEK